MTLAEFDIGLSREDTYKVLVIAGLSAFGLIPGAIAFLRGHKYAGGVLVCGMISLVPVIIGELLQLYFGLIILMGLPFWMAAMVWACVSSPREPSPPRVRRVARQRHFDPGADDAARALEDMQ